MFSDIILAKAQKIVAALTAQHKLLGLAESCTGGLIAGAITAVPGSSAVLWGGQVVYSNQAKIELLDVSPLILDRHGAVSEQVSGEMLHGLLSKNTALDIGLAITGIAGPSGGTIDKPVGLVYIGVQWRNKAPVIRRHLFDGNRETIRLEATSSALSMILEQI